MNKQLTLSITIVNLVGDTHFAVTQIGGVTVRGQKASSALRAVQNLLHRLQNIDDSDAELALELALAGTSLESQLAVTSGADEG